MAIQTGVQLQGSTLEAVRYQLETTGYWEGTIIADAFDNSPAVLAVIDGDTDLGTTIPVPPDSSVYAEIVGAVYLDDINGDTDFAESVHIAVAGSRIGSANVTLNEQQGGNLTVSLVNVEHFSNAGDTAAQLTIAAAADTTNQGIDITFANDSADEAGYFVGRVKIVCAKKGGLAKKYFTT